jgi:hypothetical protein
MAVALVYLIALVLWARARGVHDGLWLQIRMFAAALVHLGLLLAQRQLDRSASDSKRPYFIAAVVIIVLDLWTCSSAPKVFL